jgi:hypothetical protein
VPARCTKVTKPRVDGGLSGGFPLSVRILVQVRFGAKVTNLVPFLLKFALTADFTSDYGWGENSIRAI